MKVKIFATRRKFFGTSWAKGLLNLEQEISAWLEASPGIRITDIKQSLSGSLLEEPRTVISIWYETK